MDELSTEDHPDWTTNVGGSNALNSLLERRSTISNDNGILDDVVPPHVHVGVDDVGKFFSRGMRGKIEEVELYCTGNGVATVDLILTPHPCLGPFYTLQLTPAVGWAWQVVALEQMWNYDSLFIWIVDCGGAISWGGDGELPHDAHLSLDAGATWADAAHRPFIRLICTAETPGDVAISGIINNIQIPNVSSVRRIGDAVAVPMAVLTDLIVPYDGAGFLKYLIVTTRAAAQSHQTNVYVICDGNGAFGESYQNYNNRGVGVATPGVSLTQFGAAAQCTFVFTIPFEFRRELRIVGFNALGPVVMDAFVYPSLLS